MVAGLAGLAGVRVRSLVVAVCNIVTARAVIQAQHVVVQAVLAQPQKLARVTRIRAVPR